MDAGQFALFDMVEQSIFVLRPDVDGIPRYCAMNRFALDRLGRNLEDIVGKTAQELYPGRMGEIAYKRHCRAVESRQSETYRLKIPAANSIMSLHTTLNPAKDENGQILYIIGTAIDVTSSEMVGELQTHAATLSSEIEDFVSLAAHDLRTPIMNVGMLANLLREDFEDHGDGKLELIDALEDLSTTALSLISDVLSHAQATSTRADITCFDFAAMVHEIISMLDPMSRCRHNVTAGHVTGDRAATQIILRNLIDNALKHALDDEETQPLCLDILLSPAQDRNGYFSVSVRDNGRGISSEGVRYLNSGELKTDSGFGLVGVRRLLKARGGAIVAENASDGGARVTFTLPGVLDAEEHIGRVAE